MDLKLLSPEEPLEQSYGDFRVGPAKSRDEAFRLRNDVTISESKIGNYREWMEVSGGELSSNQQYSITRGGAWGTAESWWSLANLASARKENVSLNTTVTGLQKKNRSLDLTNAGLREQNESLNTAI